MGGVRIDTTSSIYPDLFLSLVIPFHIFVGAIGAFVLCPIAAFSKKGGKNHRLIGRLFLFDVILIALSGSILLVDPLFLTLYWPEQSLIHDFPEYFKSAHYPELFFLYLNTTLIYYSFSGVRIWKRIGYGSMTTIRSDWVDWCLALGMGLFALGFLVVGFFDFIHEDRLAKEFIIGGLIVLSFVIFDIYTFLVPTSVAGFPWWIIHMTKMFVVWAALVSAFWLRVRVYVLPKDYLDIHFHTGTILWLTLTLIGYMVYRKQFRS